MAFMLTCDRLKTVTRQNTLFDGRRDENSAEHSWHLALMALTLGEYAPPGADLEKVVNLLLVHDLVEVDAGDAYIPSSASLQAEQTRKEQQAARRLFGLLPADQAATFQALWDEFEARQTPEARFARDLDALAPALLTWGDGGPGRAQWGPPSAGYVAMKRRALTHPVLFELFSRWMDREGVPVERHPQSLPGDLDARIAFLLTCDQLKGVTRTTRLHDDSRFENSAEHSWHLALMVLTLGESAPVGTNLTRVTELLLVHDLVEIYAGDTFFDVSSETQRQQAERERRAAVRLYSLLPEDQRGRWQGMWEEFEARETPEARFARALDALQPMLLTWGPGGTGCTARHPDLTRERLLGLKQQHLEAFPALWAYTQRLLDTAVRNGTLPAASPVPCA